MDHPVYKIMSYNIAGYYAAENATEEQLAHNYDVVRILLSVRADILLLNEASMAVWSEHPALSEIYGMVDPLFHDREETVETGLLMLYRKDRFELSDSRTLCLTDTPTSYSKVTGSYHYRFAVFAHFRRLGDGGKFTAIGTHLENNSVNPLRFEKRNSARVLQAKALLKLMERNAAEEEAILLLGDLNSTRNSELSMFRQGGVTELLESGIFADSAELAEKSSRLPTHITGVDLDYILLTPNQIRACSYLVEEPHVAENPSDHRPVVVSFSFVK